MIAYFLEKFCITGVLFISISCNLNCGESDSQKTPTNDTLKIEGCRDKITMGFGSIVEIKLKAVPGNGYQWLIKDSSQLLQLLDADNLKFSQPETKRPTPGQPGDQRLDFKAIKKGEGKIKLVYKRTWEKESSDSCEMKIEIN